MWLSYSSFDAWPLILRIDLNGNIIEEFYSPEPLNYDFESDYYYFNENMKLAFDENYLWLASSSSLYKITIEE